MLRKLRQDPTSRKIYLNEIKVRILTEICCLSILYLMSKIWIAENTVVALAVFFLSEDSKSLRTSRTLPPASRYSAARSLSLFSLHIVTNFLSTAKSVEEEKSVLRHCPLNISCLSSQTASFFVSFLSEFIFSRATSRSSTSSREPLSFAFFIDVSFSFLEVRLRAFFGSLTASILLCLLVCLSAHVPYGCRHTFHLEPKKDLRSNVIHFSRSN